MSPSIAACLIVRNGVSTLPRLLASVRPHVDEVCVLDTGSDDGTLDLLERAASDAGAPMRLEQEPWRGDFAWARNRADAIASADYRVWFDDDEILEGGDLLQPLLAEHDPDVLYMRRVEICRPEQMISASPGLVVCQFVPRVVRAGLGSWEGQICETHVVPADSSWHIAAPEQIRVLHHPARVKGRHSYEQLARELLMTTPSRKLLAVLANAVASRRAWGYCAALCERAVDPDESLPPWPRTGPTLEETDLACLWLLAHARLQLGDLQGAADAQRRALKREREIDADDPISARMAALDAAHPVISDDPSVSDLLTR